MKIPRCVILLSMAFCALGLHAEWREFDTEHFSIIFEPENRDAAELLATFADEVHDEVSEYLAARRSARIPVIIRGDTGDANAYFTYLPTRIVLFTATPSTPIVQPNLDQWLRTVFVHELTHYFQMNDPVGWGALARFLGPSAALVNLVFTPRWMAEGLAVHTETRFSVGGRGRSPIFEMQYVAAFLADDFWSFDQTFYSSDLAPRSRVYVGGYVLVDYIIRTHGIDAFTRLTREYLAHPLLGIRRALRRTLGVDAADLYDDLLQDMDERYGSRTGLPAGQVISGRDGGYWFLVRGRTEIYGGPPTRLAGVIPQSAWADGLRSADYRATVPVNTDPFSISATDDVMVFTGSGTDELRPDSFTGFTDLYRLNRKTGEMDRVTRGRRLYHPSISENGAFVVAIERSGAFSRLVQIDLRTGDLLPIWEPEATWMASPSLAPDGRQVVLSASLDGQQDLYLVQINSGQVEQLTSSADLAEMFPVFVSPSTVWFSAALDGPPAVYEVVLSSREFSAVFADRDGVFYATPDDGGAVYLSYTSKGPSVKTTATVNRVPVEWPVSPAKSPPDSAANFVLAEIPEESPYTDWPTAEIWLPVVLPARADDGFALEAGGLIVAASPLEKNIVTAAARVHTASLAPTVALSVLHEAGPGLVQLDLATAPRYTADTGLQSRMETTATLAVGRSLFAVSTPRISHSASMSASGTFIMVSAEGITPVDHFAGPPALFAGASTGLAWDTRRPARVADLFGPAGLRLSSAVSYLAPLELVGTLDDGVALAASSSAGIRLPAGAAMFDLSTVIATASWPAAIDSPRGVSIPIRGAPETNQTPAVVLRVALDTPARLLDLGLRGFNLTRLGLSVYAQQSVDYGGGGLELRGETTVAVETAARVGYLAASFLPVVGLAATIPHSSPEQLRLSLTVRNGATLPGLVVGLGKNESPW